MPRLRLRRMLLFLVAVAVCTMLALNLTSRESTTLENDLFPGLAVSGVRRRPKFETDLSLTHPSQASLSQTKPSVHLGRTSSYPHLFQPPISSYDGLDSSAEYEKPWFMKGGTLRPKSSPVGYKPLLWPEQDDGDRIVQQLMYLPSNISTNENSSSHQRQKLKKILLYFGKGGWNDLPLGRTVFLRDRCPVDTCELSTAMRDAENADAIFFKDRFLWPFYKRSPDQVWILFLLECPLHTQGFKNLRQVFNWTATYRHDSDLVAPYEKFVSYDSFGKSPLKVEEKHYSVNKTKKVAWFVSNCNARNKRLEYARELAQHIEVDIYGTCGNKRCPRALTNRCFRMLDRDYKFYLAFENSNCKDYITEKFFVNGLSRNVVPIVMGARPEDYARAAPPHSYIHVDDFASPKDLAAYLKVLDKNDTLYNEYFRWKGTGEFINTFFWCRMCALLHAPLYHKSYADMHQWWAGHGTCSAGHWKATAAKSEPEDVKDDEDENG